MKKVKYLQWILAVEAVGALSGFLSRQGIADYNADVPKPALSPPALLFPVVWTVLYALMGFGVARIAASHPGKERSAGLNIFVIQLTVNFFWSLLFFNAQAYGLGLFWLLLLWGLILAMILQFWKVDRMAALLQIPYFLWVTFATYLNYAVWKISS